jgi:glycosyltransferase involved in cell wall biosynthesis
MSATIAPHVSLVMPCYNEEDSLGYTIPRLCRAFSDAAYRLELIACDNGSRDRTGEIIARFRAEGLPIVPTRVEVNQGYGHGILHAMPLATAPWIGVIPADGQVDAEDAVRLYESCRNSGRPVVGKVHRRFRLDGTNRAVVSAAYNGFMHMLWPGIPSYDINGLPKIVHREILERLELKSKDWLFDPELMIKAHLLGVPVLEMNVFSRMRESGSSHVSPVTALEFFKRLLAYKLGTEMSEWQRRQGVQNA